MQSTKWTFLLLFALFSCSKKEEVSVQIMGHAGMGLASNTVSCPGNSQMAIDMALSIKEVDGMELDVRFSKDSTAWFMHDSELNPHSNLTGCLEQKTDIELQKGRYNGGGNHSFVSLAEQQELWSSGKKVLLDIKPYNSCDAIFCSPQTIEKIFLSLDLKDNPNVYLLFNNETYLSYFHNKGWKVLLSSDEKEKIDQVFTSLNQVYGVLVRRNVYSQSEIQTIQEKGKWVYLYEIRSNKENREIRRLKPTGILSDDVYGSILVLKP